MNAPVPDPELVDDDGTEAEALAPVEVPRHPERPADLRPRWSQAGYASVRVVAMSTERRDWFRAVCALLLRPMSPGDALADEIETYLRSL